MIEDLDPADAAKRRSALSRQDGLQGRMWLVKRDSSANRDRVSRTPANARTRVRAGLQQGRKWSVADERPTRNNPRPRVLPAVE
jgi:hypothetical protein